MKKKLWLITAISGMLLCMPQFTAQAHYGDGFRHRHDEGYRRYEHRHDRGEYRRDFYDREERRRRWREEERRRRHDFERRRYEHRHDRRF